MDDGAPGAERQRFVQHLRVPQRLLVRVKKEMRVPLDHAGISVAPDRSITLAPADEATSGPTAAILSPSTSTCQPALRAGIDAVEHLRVAEEERVGGRRRGDGRSGDCDQRRGVPK
jgi:hypothetical protein